MFLMKKYKTSKYLKDKFYLQLINKWDINKMRDNVTILDYRQRFNIIRILQVLEEMQ